MKIVLTGATGFLGAELLDLFLNRNYSIVIVKRASTDMTPLLRRFGKIDTYGVEQLEDIFKDHPDVDAVVHAATDYGRDESELTATFWANEAFPLKLLTLALKNKLALFVNIDTFFNSSCRVEYNHLGSYALSKRHFQEWGKYCASAGAIGFLNLRLFHLYGPGDGRHKFVPTIVTRCLEGGEIDLTKGDQGRDFIHIKDAVSAVGLILEDNIRQRIKYLHYDIGTGISLSIRDFIQTVKKLTRSKIVLNFGALPNRRGEFYGCCARNFALRKLGWMPTIDIETGILTVIADILKITKVSSWVDIKAPE